MQNNDWNDEEIRQVIWDKGMPQESVEIVRKGDSNWDLGTPVDPNHPNYPRCGNCNKCRCKN